MDLRDFLRMGGLVALGKGLLSSFMGEETRPGGLDYRLLGRTGHYRSCVTLGGITVMNEEQSVADRVLEEALEGGVNAVDVAPSYGDAELKLGNAMRGHRDLLFVGCKTGKRDRAGAWEELQASLGRLQTDRVDLYQLHGLDKPEELEQVFAPGGAMEALEEARRQGLTRFLGITGHRPDTLLAALDRFDFDTIMLPYNYILDRAGYGGPLIREAFLRGCGILAIKPVAQRAWEPGETRTSPKCWYRPFRTHHEISLMVRWVLGTRVTSLIPSGDVGVFKRALMAARHYQPLTTAELAELDRLTADLKPLFETPAG